MVPHVKAKSSKDDLTWGCEPVDCKAYSDQGQVLLPPESPVVLHFGAIVQLVRTPACHAGGRGFESLSSRHFLKLKIQTEPKPRPTKQKTSKSEQEAKSSEFLPKVRSNFGVRSGNLLSAGQAAKLLGVTDKTVKAWCETGKLPAVTVPYGGRISYKVSPQAVQWFLEQTAKESQAKAAAQTKPHKGYLAQWVKAMQQGTLTGRAFSPRTIQDYEYYFGLYFGKRHEVTFEGLQSELMRLPAKQFAKREHYYKALYCFARFLVQQGHVQSEILDRLHTLAPKRHLPPKRHTVDGDGLTRLVDTCSNVSDRLIVILLSQTGLRASEACALKVGDIDLERRCLVVQCGKGGKRRGVGLTYALCEAIKAYLSEHPKAPDKTLLHNDLGKPMDRHGLRQRLERLGKTAGIKASPHALRRAFVTINAGKGRSLVHLQRSCGHSDIKTTMAYCLTSEQEVIQAMQSWD
jgi:excisionase family DNA binding protein